MKLLFIIQTPSRSGVPILLLHLMKWIKKHTTHEMEVLCQLDGPLLSDLSQLARVHVWQSYHNGTSFWKDPVKRLKQQFFPADPHAELLHYFREQKFDLLFANTIATGDLLDVLKNAMPSIPVLCHVHELEFAIWSYGAENFRKITQNSQYYMAGSNAVSDNLVIRHAIQQSHVEVVHEFIPFHELEDELPSEALRSQLQLPEGTFVVGFSGTAEWRKGTDMFLPLVLECGKKKAEGLVFVWVGAKKESVEQYQLEYDIQKLGLQKQVRIVNSVPNFRDYFRLFDCFVLLSREDPFPLVCLEAAALGKPLLCFAESGGIPELIETDAGFVVPYLDLEAMAEKILYLQNNPKQAMAFGRNARQKVKEKYSTEVQAPKIMRIIEKVVAEHDQLNNLG